ncbi:hypothetical protein C8Q72DRAFT_651340 [Fomitopsis betulina]|nr:hypothetical protein C8Q72DRAFT_651340 [Fomitopsis betulina]
MLSTGILSAKHLPTTATSPTTRRAYEEAVPKTQLWDVIYDVFYNPYRLSSPLCPTLLPNPLSSCPAPPLLPPTSPSASAESPPPSTPLPPHPTHPWSPAPRPPPTWTSSPATTTTAPASRPLPLMLCTRLSPPAQPSCARRRKLCTPQCSRQMLRVRWPHGEPSCRSPPSSKRTPTRAADGPTAPPRAPVCGATTLTTSSPPAAGTPPPPPLPPPRRQSLPCTPAAPPSTPGPTTLIPTAASRRAPSSTRPPRPPFPTPNTSRHAPPLNPWEAQTGRRACSFTAPALPASAARLQTRSVLGPWWRPW